MWLKLIASESENFAQRILPALSIAIHARAIVHPRDWAELGDDYEEAIDRNLANLQGIVILSEGNLDWLTQDALIVYTLDMARASNIPTYAIVPESIVDAIPSDHGDHLTIVPVGDDLSQLKQAIVPANATPAERATTEVQTAPTITPPHEGDVIPDDVSLPAIMTDSDVASRGQVNDIFISYSRNDKPFVSALHQRLSADDLDVWVDFEDIPQLSDWMAEIYAGIESAHTFMFIMSQHSLASFICHMEVAHARAHNKRIIPVVVQAPDRNDVYPREAIEKLNKAPRTQNEINLLAGRRAQDVLESNYWQGIKPQNWVFFADGEFSEAGYQALMDAYDTDLVHIRMFNTLFANAKRWKEGTFDNSRLLTGRDLRDARQWLQTADNEAKKPVPDALHREYIRVSQNASRRRLTMFAGIAVVVLAVIGFVLYEANQQATQRNISESQRASLTLVDQAEDALENSDSISALSLVMQANLYDNAPEQAKFLLADLALRPGIARAYEQQDLGGLTFFADGDRMLTNAVNDGLLIWDWHTGEQVSLLKAGNERLEMTDLRLIDDDTRLIGIVRSQIRVTDMQTGAELARLVAPDGTIYQYSISPDERYIAVNASFGNIYIWDLQTYELIRELRGHAAGGGYEVHFLPDGERLFTSGKDSSYILWDFNTGEQLLRVRVPQLMQTVRIEDEGDTFLASDVSDGLHRFDMQTGAIVDTFVPDADVSHFAISHDGTQVAALVKGDDGLQIVLFDRASTRILEQIAINGTMRDIFFTPDDRYVVTLTLTDDVAHLWDLSDPVQTPIANIGVNISHMAISPAGDTLALLTTDDRIRIVNIADGTTQYTLRNLPEGQTSVYFASQTRLISFRQDGFANSTTYTLWDYPSERRLGEFTSNVGDTPEFAISPDGTRFAIGGNDGTIRFEVFDISTDTPTLIREIAYNDAFNQAVGDVSAVTFLDNDTVRVVGNRQVQDLNVVTGDLQTGNADNSNFFDYFSVDWNADKTQVMGISSGTIYQIQIPDRDNVRIIGRGASASNLAQSQSGEQALFVNNNGQLGVLDFAVGTQTQEINIGQPITASVFAPDEDAIYVATGNGVITRWQYIAGLDALRQWVKENRVYNPPTCDNLVAVGMMSECNTLPDSIAIASQPTLMPIPSPTFPPSDFDPTNTPMPVTLATEIPEGTEIAVDASLLGFAGDVIIPDIQGYVANIAYLRLSEEDTPDELLRAILSPGEYVYSVGYNPETRGNDDDIFLSISDSPHADLNEWINTLGILRVGFVIDQTPAGLSYAISDSLGTTRVIAFIYDNIHYALMLEPEANVTNVLNAIATQYQDVAIITNANAGATPTSEPIVIPQEAFEFAMADDLNLLQFSPVVQLRVNDYRLYDMNTASLADAGLQEAVNLLLRTEGALLVMGYSNADDISNLALPEGTLTDTTEGIIVLQGASPYNTTAEWYNADIIWRSLGTLITVGNREVIIVTNDATDLSVYFLADKGRFFLFNDAEVSQLTMLGFIEEFFAE